MSIPRLRRTKTRGQSEPGEARRDSRTSLDSQEETAARTIGHRGAPTVVVDDAEDRLMSILAAVFPFEIG